MKDISEVLEEGIQIIEEVEEKLTKDEIELREAIEHMLEIELSLISGG